MRRKGFTLIEVMAAFMIFMLAVEMVMLGMAASMRVSRRAQRAAKADVRVRSGEDRIPARFYMRISEDAEPLTGYGYVCREEMDEDTDGLYAVSVWMELPVELEEWREDVGE